MNQSPALPVAIVGGGITGLSAAYRLQKQGVPFVLFESAPRGGGYLHTIEKEGYTLECGPNTILETSASIGSMVEELGLAGTRLAPAASAGKNYVVRGGQLLPLPQSPAAFATSRLFSTAAKLRLMGEPFVGRGPDAHEETIADFVVRRLGREFLDYAINPFVSGIYAGDPGKLSVKQAFPKLDAVEQRYGSLILGQFLGARERKRSGERSKATAPKFSFERGLEELPEALCRKLAPHVRTGTAVIGLRSVGDQWEVETAANGAAARELFSAVLLTAPAHRLATIPIRGVERATLLPLGNVVHAPVAVVHLGFPRANVQHSLEGFGFLVPAVERMHILGSTFSSTLFPNRAPKDHVLLTTFVGGLRNPDLVEQSDAELIDVTLRDLKKLIGVQGRPVMENVVRYPMAIPQYNVGYSRFKALLNDVETACPGLAFAGTFRDGISVANAISAGFAGAEKIALTIPKTSTIAAAA